MTAGPAIPAPLPITTKMPVPMMAPTPIAVSWVTPTAFFRPCPSSDVSVIRERTSRTAKIPGRSDVVAMVHHPPPLATADATLCMGGHRPQLESGAETGRCLRGRSPARYREAMGEAVMTTRRQADGAFVIEVRGSLDAATVDGLRAAILGTLQR